MKKQAELNFFLKIIKSFHLPYNFVSSPYDDKLELDLGIRTLLDPIADFTEYFKTVSSKYSSNTIYCIKDQFRCNYIIFKLPDREPETCLYIGPFLTEPFSTEEFHKNIETYTVPSGLLKQIEHYYRFLPLVQDSSILLNLLTVLGETLWDGSENFSIENIESPDASRLKINTNFPFFQEDDFPAFSVKRIEERYETENQFIIAVSQGNTLKAEQLAFPHELANLEPRTSEILRNEKNYTIILNTLLRKAAELGSVHPYHIDAISSRYARKIETVTSQKEVVLLHREMIHKYCLLVKNHSMKGYSLLIRKVLTIIDTDLTADLTLNALASQLNVNSSYLSTLFKKETGCTLTEFVNRKRIDHALLLLNSTNLQIQEIAKHCGILDVNYFTKLFKKQINKAPKEYRESLNSSK